MGYVKSIDREKIQIGEKYWTCGWSGRVVVTIIEKLGKDKVLVKAGKKGNPFIRGVEWIFDNEINCKRAGKSWEHFERKHKRVVKEKRKNKSKSTEQCQ